MQESMPAAPSGRFGPFGGRGGFRILAGQAGGEDEPQGGGPGRRPGATSD